MLKYEYINKEWIVSPTARRVYRASAALSVALFFSWWAILFVGGDLCIQHRIRHRCIDPDKWVSVPGGNYCQRHDYEFRREVSL